MLMLLHLHLVWRTSCTVEDDAVCVWDRPIYHYFVVSSPMYAFLKSAVALHCHLACISCPRQLETGYLQLSGHISCLRQLETGYLQLSGHISCLRQLGLACQQQSVHVFCWLMLETGYLQLSGHISCLRQLETGYLQLSGHISCLRQLETGYLKLSDHISCLRQLGVACHQLSVNSVSCIAWLFQLLPLYLYIFYFLRLLTLFL